MVEVEELETYLLGPSASDVAGIIAVLVKKKNMCDGGGNRRFVFIKKSADNVVAVCEHFLFSPGDEAISILSFAENACDEGGRKKFAVAETKSEAWKRRSWAASSKLCREIRTVITGSCRKPSST